VLEKKNLEVNIHHTLNSNFFVISTILFIHNENKRINWSDAVSWDRWSGLRIKMEEVSFTQKSIMVVFIVNYWSKK